MAKLPSIPSISSLVPREISALLRPMREILTAFTSGDSQVATVGNLRRSGLIAGVNGDGSFQASDGYDTTPPPAPTNLTAGGALANIMLGWDATSYNNLAYAEVWRAQTDDFSLAQLIGRGDGRIYVDNVGGAAVRYYWIRYVSRANIPGPFNAQLGTRGETGADAGYLLSLLTGQITESQLYADLGSKIDLITDPSSTVGSVAQRIAAEATARASAIAAEAAARSAAIAVETSARTTAISSAATLNAANFLAEAAARGTAIGVETTLRTAGDVQLAADVAFATAASNTSVAAYEQAVTAMSVGDSALASSITSLAAQTATDITAAVLTETTARTNADQSEAAARATMLAQFAGTYTGNDLNAITTGLLYQERIARASTDGALAQQMSLLSAGVGGGFDPYQTWYFDSTVEGWTASGATLAATAGNLVVTSTGTAPQIISPAAAMLGPQYATVKARITRKAGAGWLGSVLYSTSGHGFSTSYRKTIAQTIAIGETVIIDWDMTALTAGGTDWTGNTITGLRLDLGTTAADVFDIDWIATGRNAPAASVASLNGEVIVRAQADSAQVTAREALSAKLIGTIDPATIGAVANLSSGLLFEEKSLRTTSDTALGTRIDTLTTTVNSNTANITSEATTRATADAALSIRVDTVTATTGTNTTAIASELTARASADTALGVRIDTVVATTDTSIGANTAAIVVEQTARTAEDIALANFSDYIFAATTTSIAAAKLAYSAQVTSDTAVSTRLEALVASTATGINASITSEQTVRVGAEGALSTRIDEVVATATGSAATIVEEQLARAAADSAEAAARVTLAARVTAAEGSIATTSAAILDEQTVRADADSANATSISQVQAVVSNPVTGLVDQYAAVKVTSDATVTALGKVQAKHVVNVEVDGIAGGFGIIGTGDGLASTVDFGVRANSFFIAPPSVTSAVAPTVDLYDGYVWRDTSVTPNVTRYRSGAEWITTSPALPYIVRTTPTTINGVSVPAGTYIADAFIANGTITNAKIGDAAIDNAKIASLDAGKITTGYIDAARINVGSLDAKIASIDYAQIISVDAATISVGQLTAGQIDARGLSIKDAAGNVILSAGSSLSSQVSTNRNLVESVNSWAVNAGAWIHTNSVWSVNKHEIVLPAGGNANSRVLALESGIDYTLSFKAHAASAATLTCDLYPDNLPETTFSITTTPTVFSVTWNSASANMNSCNLRVIGGAAQIEVYDIKLERGSIKTPWCDNVITSANASTYIASAAIDLAQIKVASIGSLSALTANIGLLRTASSGQRTEFDSNGVRVYDASGVLRVRMGVW